MTSFNFNSLEECGTCLVRFTRLLSKKPKQNVRYCTESCRTKAQYKKHKKRKLKQNYEWKEKNKEKVIEDNRSWYIKNKDRKNAQDKIWSKLNMSRKAGITARRRLRIKNQTPELTEAETFLILTLYRHSKLLGLLTGIKHEVDHIIPVSKGGLHHPNNLQILTEYQNRKKGQTYITEGKDGII